MSKTGSWTWAMHLPFPALDTRRAVHMAERFALDFARDDSVYSCNEMTDSLLLIHAERKRPWLTVALLSCQSIRRHLPQQSHTSLKLKLPATLRLGGCVMDASSAYPTLHPTLPSWLQPEKKKGRLRARRASRLYKINDWCHNQWPLEARC